MVRAQDVIDKASARKNYTRRRSRESGDSLKSRPKRQNLRKCFHRCQNCSVRSTCSSQELKGWLSRVGDRDTHGWGQAPRSGTFEVLDNLGHELKLMESDDEPLVRSTEGRNVVPRISSLEATEASERRRSDVRFVHDEGAPSTVPAESFPNWVDRDASES